MRSRTSVTRAFPALVLVVASLGWAAPAGALAPSLAVGTNVNVSRLLESGGDHDRDRSDEPQQHRDGLERPVRLEALRGVLDGRR
jgi:hypothetical protein